MPLHEVSRNLPVGRFEADLRTVCGQYDIRPTKGKAEVWGGVSVDKYASIEMAMVATNLQQIIRTAKNIRRDDGENYFLIMQQEGRALMAQNDARVVLLPGDMILIDSARPSEFTFFGDRSTQVSLHLPRGEVHDRFGDDVPGGLSLSRGDPTTKAIQAVIAKAIKVESRSPQNGYLRDALFGLLGAFLFDRDIGRSNIGDYDNDFGSGLLGKALEYIETRFRDPDFSVNDIADTLGVAIRQVQRAFENLGITPTKFLLAKRLEFARSRLDARQAGIRDELISHIAYSAGFSDLSYFNRRFREAFGCSPGEYGNGN